MAADAADVHAASTAWTSTLSASDSAGHDLDRGMDVVCSPRLDIPREGGAVVPLADAVQQVDLDLARAMLHAKARRSSSRSSRNSAGSTRKRTAATVPGSARDALMRIAFTRERSFNSPLAGGSL